MALDTVADYIARCRTLLQDTVNSPYRYSDAELVDGLNNAVLEARRLRPDIIMSMGVALTAEPPAYSSTNETVAVPIDPQYRMAFVYYMLGAAQLRDEENTQDARSSAFLQKFIAQLTVLQA